MLAVCVTAAAYARCPSPDADSVEDAKTAARIERHRLGAKENGLFVTGASGITAYNQLVAGVKLEYSRQIKGNFYWGTAFSARWHLGSHTNYDWDGFGPSPYRNTVAQDIYKLDAMAYYRLPVVKSRLFLRFGAGVGAGYHRVADDAENPLEGDKVLPYFNVECAWIVRVTRDFELKFSPTLLLVPSEFSVSPGRLGAPTDVTPWLTDVGFSLTLGWRF